MAEQIENEQNNQPQQVTEQAFHFQALLNELSAQRNQAQDNNVRLAADLALAKAKFEEAVKVIQQKDEIIQDLTKQLQEKENLILAINEKSLETTN